MADHQMPPCNFCAKGCPRLWLRSTAAHNSSAFLRRDWQEGFSSYSARPSSLSCLQVDTQLGNIVLPVVLGTRRCGPHLDLLAIMWATFTWLCIKGELRIVAAWETRYSWLQICAFITSCWGSGRRTRPVQTQIQNCWCTPAACCSPDTLICLSPAWPGNVCSDATKAFPQV